MEIAITLFMSMLDCTKNMQLGKGALHNTGFTTLPSETYALDQNGKDICGRWRHR